MQPCLQERTQRSRHVWWRCLGGSSRRHCGDQAAVALPWSPESCRAQVRGRLEPQVAGSAAAATARVWPCCRACSRAILFSQRSIIRLAFTISMTCQVDVHMYMCICRAAPSRRSLRTVCVLYACNVHAVCMQFSCSVHAVYMQHHLVLGRTVLPESAELLDRRAPAFHDRVAKRRTDSERCRPGCIGLQPRHIGLLSKGMGSKDSARRLEPSHAHQVR